MTYKFTSCLYTRRYPVQKAVGEKKNKYAAHWLMRLSEFKDFLNVPTIKIFSRSDISWS